MPMLTLDCARCGAQKMTHDVKVATMYYSDGGFCYEYAVQCRACNRSAVWQVGKKESNAAPDNLMEVNHVIDDYVNVIALVRPRATALGRTGSSP